MTKLGQYTHAGPVHARTLALGQLCTLRSRCFSPVQLHLAPALHPVHKLLQRDGAAATVQSNRTVFLSHEFGGFPGCRSRGSPIYYLTVNPAAFLGCGRLESRLVCG